MTETATMRALVRRTYGGPEVAEVAEVARPPIGDDQVLVRVRAAGVNPLDWHFLTGVPYIARAQLGLRSPKQPILGVDMAGEVEAVGAAVTEFRPGDAVFGEVGGAFAEYVRARAAILAPKPADTSFEEAAAVPVAGFTALQALRDSGRLRPGQSVLVVGASGGVGTFAVQIARALGATEVGGVCSTANVELVRSLGADHVVDYTREDFTESGRRYDLIVDNAGTAGLRAVRRVLRPAGTYVLVSGPKHRFLGPMRNLIAALVYSRFVSQRMVGMLAQANRDDLVLLADLIAAGKVAPVVESCYPLAEGAAAISHLGTGHARGKTVLTI